MESRLESLSGDLERQEELVVKARNSGKLAKYDLSKLRLERFEKEVEVARLEGRPEVKKNTSG